MECNATKSVPPSPQLDQKRPYGGLPPAPQRSATRTYENAAFVDHFVDWVSITDSRQQCLQSTHQSPTRIHRSSTASRSASSAGSDESVSRLALVAESRIVLRINESRSNGKSAAASTILAAATAIHQLVRLRTEDDARWNGWKWSRESTASSSLFESWEVEYAHAGGTAVVAEVYESSRCECGDGSIGYSSVGTSPFLFRCVLTR